MTGKLNSLNGDLLTKLALISEIEKGINSASPHKAPRSDGFNAHFFKVCLSIVGKEVSNTIQTSFKCGKLLSQVNTFVVLVPKNDNPLIPADYRPISLTNELYKIIIRIIVNKMKLLMEKIINPSQTALVSRRSITDSILLSHDLLSFFHLNKGNPKTCLKLDISKAFDRIREDPLESNLLALNFPLKVTQWIMHGMHQES